MTPHQVDSGGLDAQGLDLYALGQDFAALTGRPNPIPAPAPSPAPVAAQDGVAEGQGPELN